MSTNEAQSDVDQDPPLLELEQAEGPVDLDAIELESADQVEQIEASEAEIPELEPAKDAVGSEVPVEAHAANDDAMDTVRELLFGESLKAVRRELHLTVRNLRGSVKVMHHELKQRGDDLADQISAMQLMLDNESAERDALSDIVTEQINQSSEQLSVKLTEQQEAVDVAIKQINTDVELAGNNQAHAMEELEKKVFASLEEYSAEFRDGKMNRSDFADMLSSLAGKVSAPEE